MRIVSLLLVLVGASVGACGGDASAPEASAPSVARVDVTPPSATLRVGQQTRFVATARDASGNALSSAVSWTLSNPGKATIAQDGTLSASDSGAVILDCNGRGEGGNSRRDDHTDSARRRYRDVAYDIPARWTSRTADGDRSRLSRQRPDRPKNFVVELVERRRDGRHDG